MRYALVALLLLAACTPATQTATQPADNGPLPREQPQATPQPTPQNTSNTNQSFNDSQISYNDDGYEEWRRQARNAVVLLVSDGEQAARAYLQETEQVTLDLRTPITIQVGAVEQGRAQLIIDNRSEIVEEDSEAYNSDKSILVYLSETITT